MRRVRVDPITPGVSVIDEAAAVILAGGVVALPTDTLYGLAADPFNSRAIARVFSLKGRDAEQALALVAGDFDQVVSCFGKLDGIAGVLAERFWPGPLTMLLDAPNGIVAGVSSPDGRVGVRVPSHQVPRALCLRSQSPLTATSANVSGRPAPADADLVEQDLSPELDLLLDGGPSPGGEPSTIVDVAGGRMRLVRAGAIPWESIQALVR